MLVGQRHQFCLANIRRLLTFQSLPRTLDIAPKVVIHDAEEETFQQRGSRKRPSTSLTDGSAIAFPAWTLQTYSSISVPIHRQAQNGCTCLSNRTQTNFTSFCSPFITCALHPVRRKGKPMHHQVCKKDSIQEHALLSTTPSTRGSELFRATCRCSYALISKTHACFCPTEAHTGENHQPVYLHYSLNKQKRAGQRSL